MGKYAVVLVSTLFVFIFTYTMGLRNVYLESENRVTRAQETNQANNMAQSVLMAAVRGIGSHEGLTGHLDINQLPSEGDTFETGPVNWPGMDGQFNLVISTIHGDPAGTDPVILELTATGLMHDYSYTSTVRGQYTPEGAPHTFDGFNREYAVYSRNQIIMGGGSINGPIATNAAMNGAVTMDWGASINGDVSVGPGADVNEALQTPEWGGHLHQSGSVSVLPDEIEYELPPFPEFPTNTTPASSQHPSHSAGTPYVHLDVYSGSPLHISEIHLAQNTQLTLRLQGNGPHQVVVDDLNIPQGHLNINTMGSDDKTLQMYVNNSFVYGGGGGDSSINKNGEPDNMELYYSGSDDVWFNQGTDFRGMMHINNPDVNVEMSGGATFGGMLVVSGGSVNIAGGLDASPTALHAPNSHITLSGGAQVVGSITGDTVVFQDGGNASVTFDDDFMNPGTEVPEEETQHELAFRILRWH
ncbi:hypothetical protein QLX67_03770 [Balneolaceae bacterium ANBcel3]|nr:hypothetical protein [Balneolaceae bacterium ANBcel3]